MTTIKKICNYTESSSPSKPIVDLYYLEQAITNSEEHDRETKRINREYKLDIVLGIKSDFVEESKFTDYLNSSPIEYDPIEQSTLTSKVMTIRVNSSRFTTEKDLEKTLFYKLDKLTDIVGVNKNKDVVFDYSESIDYNIKKVVSNIRLISHLLRIENRGVYVNTIIIGRNILEFNNILGVDVIRSSLINPNKIIIMNRIDSVSPGLIVVNHVNDNSYYMSETPNWNKYIKSFLIT
jgi:hypothetical protein